MLCSQHRLNITRSETVSDLRQRSDERLARAQGAVTEGWRGYPQAATAQEDIERTNAHYDLPPEFFLTLTGGRWNCYSCNLWDGATTETESQERKLDFLAELMQLRPGQRVLDVGCGWGGPLVYLAKRYAVRGVGLMLSAPQLTYAQERARSERVDVDFRVCHWRDFEDGEPFDAVYTDEVIVHFQDQLGYFQKVRTLLRERGVMLSKEAHFASGRYFRPTAAGVVVSDIFEESGSYGLLHDELALVDRAGFALERTVSIPIRNYRKTLEAWQANLTRSRDRLEDLVGPEQYRRYLRYLRIGSRIVAGPWMTLDVVLARAPANGAANRCLSSS
jgi:cyclopropane-fatty-acyl-phospholipid synthase